MKNAHFVIEALSQKFTSLTSEPSSGTMSAWKCYHLIFSTPSSTRTWNFDPWVVQWASLTFSYGSPPPPPPRSFSLWWDKICGQIVASAPSPLSFPCVLPLCLSPLSLLHLCPSPSLSMSLCPVQQAHFIEHDMFLGDGDAPLPVYECLVVV